MRILQVGFGMIGREIWGAYREALVNDDYMVIDLVHHAPDGYAWDRGKVDLAVIVVNTPAAKYGDGFDYSDLEAAVAEYLTVAEFVLIRSTVGLGFLHSTLYLDNAERIGFAPEFYGATKWSRRAVLDMGFSIFTDNVPPWFWSRVGIGELLIATAPEVIVAKLTENAFLATKVTFFHELYLTCERLGIDFEGVRQIVTADPRIGRSHSYVEELGWQSHCLDKDVPAFARLGPNTHLVTTAIGVNRIDLLPRRLTAEPRIG